MAQPLKLLHQKGEPLIIGLGVSEFTFEMTACGLFRHQHRSLHLEHLPQVWRECFEASRVDGERHAWQFFRRPGPAEGFCV